MLDILMNFRTAYYNTRGRLVSSRGAIARHYASTWLGVDVLAAMPWDTMFSVLHAANFLNLVKITRLFRLLRMVKAVKLRHHASTPAFLSSVEVHIALFDQYSLCFSGAQASSTVENPLMLFLPWPGVPGSSQLSALGLCLCCSAPCPCSGVLLPLHRAAGGA